MVSLLTRLFGAPPTDRADQLPFAEMRAAIGASPIGYQVGRPQWPAQDVTTYVNKGYRNLVIAYRCVQVLANNVATAPLRVYVEANGQREPDETHPLRRLITVPNQRQSEAELISYLTMNSAVTGFTVIEKERSAAGRVVALWPLRSDWIKPIPRDQASPDWEYKVPGRTPVLLRSSDVVVYTHSDSPDQPYTGLSPLTVATREVGIENLMTDFLNVFFQRGATPIWGLIPQEGARMDQAKADAMKAMFAQRLGLSKAAEPLVLESVKEIKRLGFDFDEMAYPELRKLTEAHICSAFGVPPILVGAQVGLENSPWSNTGEMRRLFYQDTIIPLWNRLDGALTRGLLPEFETRPGYSLEFDSSDVEALQQDETPRWDRAVNAFRARIITRNQALIACNLPVRDDALGEELYNPVVGIGGEDADATTARAIPAMTVREIPARSNGHGLYRLPPERRVHTADHARQRYDALTDQFAPALLTFWQAQGERVIEAATRSVDRLNGLNDRIHEPGRAEAFRLAAVANQEVRDVAEVAWDEEQRELLTVLNRLYDAAGQTAIDDVADQLGLDLAWDLANPNVHRVLSDLATRIVGISQTTRGDVARIVGAALDEGVDLPTLAARLRTLFTETYQGRALAVARTESMVAYNVASVLGYRESGVVEMAELADNSRHSEGYGASDGLTCAQRDGLIVPLESVGRHIEAEHPNGSLAVLPVLNRPLGGAL